MLLDVFKPAFRHALFAGEMAENKLLPCFCKNVIQSLSLERLRA